MVQYKTIFCVALFLSGCLGVFPVYSGLEDGKEKEQSQRKEMPAKVEGLKPNTGTKRKIVPDDAPQVFKKMKSETSKELSRKKQLKEPDLQKAVEGSDKLIVNALINDNCKFLEDEQGYDSDKKICK